MIIRTVKQAFNKVITIPGSKSITNRALLLSAMAKGESHLDNLLLSDDTFAMIEALRSLGVDIKLDQDSKQAIVQRGSFKFDAPIQVNINNSGTTARFITALCGAIKGNFIIQAKEQMQKRPMSGFYEALESQGVSIKIKVGQSFPCEIHSEGLLPGGEIIFNENTSSQFVSAILMAAPFFKNKATIIAKALSRDAYIQMTTQMMKVFGVDVEEIAPYQWVIESGQAYQVIQYKIEPDLSSASYFLAAAAMTNSEITIPGVSQESIQGDRAFVEVLEQMGFDIRFVEEGLNLKGKKNFQGVTVDMSNCSDTFMTLACMAPFADTPSLIKGLSHTKHHEVERVKCLGLEFEKLNIQYEYGDDFIKIYPSKPLATKLDSHHDHRLAMSLALIGLKIPGIEINNADAVTKTFPEYFYLLKGLSE